MNRYSINNFLFLHKKLLQNYSNINNTIKTITQAKLLYFAF